ncbi:MAG: TetR/AcrR family transcriptional regulator [Eubacteriales bacterium]
MGEKNRDRILQLAGDLFNSRGYRNVTIDDIAAGMGMSKKTIYQYFSGKEEIAGEFLMSIMGRIAGKAVTLDKSYDPVTRLRHILRQVKEELTQVNPLFLEDIQKHAPDLWEKYERLREQKILLMEELVMKGQETGLLKEINPKLTVLIFLSAVKALNRPDVMTRYGFFMEEVFEAIIEIFLTGIKKNGERP